ncbi:hypothetical protein MIT9_P0932 [Methylomarinovum caldicuralii]|uniref:Glycosyltransferase subfamily 4-like N-terminal domain-containing protein n=1 Tax=Methylomarinovum caldicuralii TaxID=438856 RepID=A0AAU9C2K0_9GAMM|nr:glycosyltransferase [Methylomarinovum caldicuralii]BCX81354.1 hypothetical protein MIT9_P0932 [Methylomarinovum caldicuralii]
MRIAIVHYHLRPGGVTRVIEHAARLLRASGRQVVVLAAEAPEDFPVPVKAVKALAYDEGKEPVSVSRLHAALADAAAAALGGAPDVWHFHNHHLGKNLALPPVVARLAAAGARLLLQVHDFPEDFRPYNYQRLRRFLDEDLAACYPSAPQVHYAVLNSRDRAFLAGAGVAAERLHLLPNPVWLPPQDGEAGRWPEGRLWLYPTRAIRRKNIGELLLWATLAEPGDHFATSLAPENPREQRFYRHWVSLAQELALPLSFDLARRSGWSFPAMVRAAHCLVTTSVAEGFGMAFLEPWLLERPVSGRDLPDITADFRGAGLALDHLYPRLDIPVEWLGEKPLRQRLVEGLRDLYRAYGLPEPTAEQCERAWAAWVREGRVDFGRLDEPLQTQVIRRLHHSAAARRMLPRRLAVPSPQTVARNRTVALGHYDLHHYGKRLESLYAALLAAPCRPPETLDAAALLHRFLQPERLCLLRL